MIRIVYILVSTIAQHTVRSARSIPWTDLAIHRHLILAGEDAHCEGCKKRDGTGDEDPRSLRLKKTIHGIWMDEK